jgi:hypothetical protein
MQPFSITPPLWPPLLHCSTFLPLLFLLGSSHFTAPPHPSAALASGLGLLVLIGGRDSGIDVGKLLALPRDRPVRSSCTVAFLLSYLAGAIAGGYGASV